MRRARKGSSSIVALVILLAGAACERPDRNPYQLVDAFGKLEANPLNVGDETTAAKETGRFSQEQIANLWLSPDGREECRAKSRMRSYPGNGEGRKFDNCMDELTAEGRIIPIAVGECVRITDVAPPPGRQYTFTHFKVEVLTGPHRGKSGWVSLFGLEHFGSHEC